MECGVWTVEYRVRVMWNYELNYSTLKRRNTHAHLENNSQQGTAGCGGPHTTFLGTRHVRPITQVSPALD